MTAGELRVQLRAQQTRNNSANERNCERGEDRGNATVSDAVAVELRSLIAVILAGDADGDRAEALAVALADSEAALRSFRALVADLQPAPPAAVADDGMRSCRQCANLTTSGRCLAAWRGESFGDGIAVRRDFAPLDPDRPQRCAGCSPGPDDPDRRMEVERWPLLTGWRKGREPRRRVPCLPAPVSRWCRRSLTWAARTRPRRRRRSS